MIDPGDYRERFPILGTCTYLINHSLAASRPITVAGQPGVEYEYAGPHRVLRASMATIGSRRFLLTASAPKWGADQRRFVESFTVSTVSTVSALSDSAR